MNRWYFPAKALFDCFASLLLLIVLLPVTLFAAALVKVTSRGPAFYRQTRLGKSGRPFTIIKLRTMVDHAEAATGPIWSGADDPRITFVGRFLRATHIDEFPQLFNVLSGQMSLVGPRPERPEFASTLGDTLPRYVERLKVRPGITGIAQLRLPPDTDVDGVRKKLGFDLYYVRHAGPWLDLLILVHTSLDWLKYISGAEYVKHHFIKRLPSSSRRLIALPRWEAVAHFVPASSDGHNPPFSPENHRDAGNDVQPVRIESRHVVGNALPAIPSAATGQMPLLHSSMLNAFTVDVEDYFHVNAFSSDIDPQSWGEYESRVVSNTQRLLDLLEEYQVRGTFFVLGWVADRHPELVNAIHRAGHELGCHSFWHRSIFNLTPDEFREDLLQGARAIEEITGERVTAYRAPNFSITAKSLWALEILVEEGFQYDSSIFPVYHDCYGIPAAERAPCCIETSRGSLWEFPLSVYRWMGRLNVPVAGGGYFRLYPSNLSAHWLSKLNRDEKRPFVFYIHPWELDPDQPRLSGTIRAKFRHYQNLASTEAKLKRLLSRFRFGSLSDSLLAYFGDDDTNSGRKLTIEQLASTSPD